MLTMVELYYRFLYFFNGKKKIYHVHLAARPDPCLMTIASPWILPMKIVTQISSLYASPQCDVWNGRRSFIKPFKKYTIGNLTSNTNLHGISNKNHEHNKI